jgi:lipopolysaccharide export system permease protein
VLWRILYRMIFIELVKIFVLSLLGITGIIVMAGIVAEASQQGLNPAQVLAAIPLLVPSFLPYTIPATTLFATCIVYGRLAHDNEILAIKAAGINILQVVLPALVLGTLMSGVTLALYYHLIPYTHRLLRTQFLNNVEEYLYALLQKDHCIKQPGLPYAIWARQVHGRRLVDPVFKRQDAKGNYDLIAKSNEAELHVDLVKGELIVHMRHGEVFGSEDGKGRMLFHDKEWPVALPADFNKQRKPKPRDMVWRELLVDRRALTAERDQLQITIGADTARMHMNFVPVDLPKHVDNLRNAVHHKQIEINCLDAELQMRPALAFGCLFFVLVGCPVGIWFSRSDYLSAFITCFLPIVLLYYPVLLCSTNFAKDGKLPAAVALWASDGLLALIAPFLFRRLLKH